MARIFVSHAHEDRDAAHQITAMLGRAGLDPWLDVQELRSGDELLRTLAHVLAAAEYFAIVLTHRALTKPWVLTEMRMALTAEIEKGRPKVLVLRLDDCGVPIELRHKVYLDFRGRFAAALAELADHVRGVAQTVPPPKQTILAEMIKSADPELWGRLGAGSGDDDWRQHEVADIIRDLRADALEAAVSIGSMWTGQRYKAWESQLVAAIRHGRAAEISTPGARRIIKRLTADGFLLEAEDLDYRQSEKAWCDGSLLWILRRAARRSHLFPALPPPQPERLSSLLVYEKPMQITGSGWYAVRFAGPLLTALDAREVGVVAVARQADAPQTWVFRAPDDRAPLKADRHLAPTDLTPADPCAALAEGRDIEVVGFDLATFDDLGLLGGEASGAA